MQIEQVGKKGMFQQAQVLGEQGGPAVRDAEKQVKKEGVVTDSVPVTQTVTYTRPDQEQGANFEDIKHMAETKDAVQTKNAMVVGANTSTPESVQELEEDGFSLSDTDIHTVVTETDKIRMQLAKAGKDTSYFSGELSEEQLAEITGSAALAAQYASALNQAEAIRPLSEGAMKYLLDNELEPTINHIYLAQFNAAHAYVTQPDEQLDEPQIAEQIEKVIAAAGMEHSEQNIWNCKWLAANGISVTAAHLTSLCALQNLQLPPKQEELLSAMQTAVAEEKTPADAYLVEGVSLTDRAADAVEVIEQTTDRELAYVISQGEELTIENLREAHHLIESGAAGEEWEQPAFSTKGLSLLEARRMLEETRLVMTTEANYGLLKRGMEIEITPLVELVEELKTQEQSYYKQLLESNGSEATQAQITLFQETTQTVYELQTMPAYVLGSGSAEGTLQELHTAGAQLQAKMDAAGEAYETLMTAPRADMGDSIQKAFRNVDDILQEIGMEPTQANARAVRILAYNHMEINEQSVLEMKLADRQVQQAFDSLKPAVVREMIRDGVNPLHMQISELNERAEQIHAQVGGADDLTKFSEYLWKLEQNHDLSVQERDSFIGIYRLIHQVELGDGAAVGALLQQGAPLTMGNLLSAVRSGKKGAMDYKVDDEFGGVQGSTSGVSITDQINAAYQTQCIREVQQTAQEPEQFAQLLSGDNWTELSPEQLLEQIQQASEHTQADEAYNRELLKDLNAAAAVRSEVYEMLENYHVPVTVNNVLAMQQMLASPNDALRRFFKLADSLEDEDGKADLMKEISKIKDDILHKLGENIQAPEELAEAQRTLAEVAEHCGQTVMYEGMTRLDIRQLQMMTTQLHLGVSLTKEERYQIPVLTSDGVVGVNLRIIRGSGKKGSVRITMESAAYGKLAAELQAGEEGIRGYMASDSRAGADRLQREQPHVEELLTELAGDSAEVEIHMIFSEHLDLSRFELSGGKSERSDGTEQEVQTGQLYGIAEKMVQFFREGITKAV